MHYDPGSVIQSCWQSIQTSFDAELCSQLVCLTTFVGIATGFCTGRTKVHHTAVLHTVLRHTAVLHTALPHKGSSHSGSSQSGASHSVASQVVLHTAVRRRIVSQRKSEGVEARHAWYTSLFVSSHTAGSQKKKKKIESKRHARSPFQYSHFTNTQPAPPRCSSSSHTLMASDAWRCSRCLAMLTITNVNTTCGDWEGNPLNPPSSLITIFKGGSRLARQG